MQQVLTHPWRHEGNAQAGRHGVPEPLGCGEGQGCEQLKVAAPTQQLPQTSNVTSAMTAPGDSRGLFEWHSAQECLLGLGHDGMTAACLSICIVSRHRLIAEGVRLTHSTHLVLGLKTHYMYVHVLITGCGSKSRHLFEQ